MVLAAGAVAGVALAPAPVPATLAAASEITTAPVTSATFDDQRSVTVTPSVITGRPVKVATGGVVTDLTCAAGRAVRSGTSFVSVDGKALLALHTDVPLWRDLAVGTKGKDVASVQRELRRLGHETATDGTYGLGTAAAVKAAQTAAGAPATGKLGAEGVVWLPAATTTPKGCGVISGDRVAPGDTLFTTADQLVSVRVGQVDGAEPDGAHVVRVGDVQAKVPASGVVTDDAFLAALRKDPVWATWVGSDGKEEPTVTYVLPKPIPVLAVAPAALYAVDGENRACLLAQRDDAADAPAGTAVPAGTPVAVTIVSSQLGQTMVRLDDTDQTAPTTADLRTTGAPGCR